MKLVMQITDVKTWASNGLSNKTPVKVLAGLALGALVVLATAVPSATLQADGPGSPAINERTEIKIDDPNLWYETLEVIEDSFVSINLQSVIDSTEENRDALQALSVDRGYGSANPQHMINSTEENQDALQALSVDRSYGSANPQQVINSTEENQDMS